MWMSFAEALARVGSLEELIVVLREGHAYARATDLRMLPDGISTKADRSIPNAWWAADTVRRISPFLGRAWFELKVEGVSREIVAIGIEVEPVPVEALWPAASVHTPRHAGGRDPDNDWEGAAGHVDAWVAARGPLPRHKDGKPNVARAVELMTEWFDKNDPPAPRERSMRRWISNHPRSWWGPN